MGSERLPNSNALSHHLLRRFAEPLIELSLSLSEGKRFESPMSLTLRLWKDRNKFRMKDVDSSWLEFRDTELEVTTDWFSMRTPAWKWTIENHLPRSRVRNVLEIGSWEGVSANYILRNFPDAKVTCVDTWEGSDEHTEGYDMDEVERRFDRNVARFGDRVEKIKKASVAFFREDSGKLFDLIYVDGSHHFTDVLVDAFCSHKILATGGALIFDDYLWDNYSDPQDNPRRAINYFLRISGDRYRVVFAGYQVILIRR